jgi:hypothetical protein
MDEHIACVLVSASSAKVESNAAGRVCGDFTRPLV